MVARRDRYRSRRATAPQRLAQTSLTRHRTACGPGGRHGGTAKHRSPDRDAGDVRTVDCQAAAAVRLEVDLREACVEDCGGGPARRIAAVVEPPGKRRERGLQHEHVLRALRAGASGFLLKDTPPDRIVDAVRKVAAGDPILSPQITRRLMDRVATESGSYESARASLAALSPREYDVVLAVAQGRTNAEIGRDLFMSVATVKAHISHILTKLDLDNRTQIALLAHDAGLG